MANEQIFEQHFAIEDSLCNPLGGLKPAEFLFLIQETTLGGSAFVGAGVEKVRALGLFWVLMNYHFAIERMPHVGERISIRTYPGPARAFIYPRHYAVIDEEGNTIIRGISLWALLDKTTHRPTFPAKNGINPIGQSFPGELPWPTTLALGPVSLKETRLVRYSDLDFNGHMNNVRYLDYALDSEKSTYFDTAVIKELQINFSTETQLNEEMEISTGKEGPAHYYQGRVQGRNVFAIKIIVAE